MGTRRNPDGQSSTRSWGVARKTPRLSRTSARSPIEWWPTAGTLGVRKQIPQLEWGTRQVSQWRRGMLASRGLGSVVRAADAIVHHQVLEAMEQQGAGKQECADPDE